MFNLCDLYQIYFDLFRYSFYNNLVKSTIATNAHYSIKAYKSTKHQN